MFWETCAKHSFEILAALLGSGILGYLWSRWFGGNGKKIVDNSAYEHQIRSLRDRIKQQDIDLQATASLKDTWSAEKDSLHQQINSLNADMDSAKLTLEDFVSPDIYQELQQKIEEDAQRSNQKLGMITAERDGLMHTIKDLETRLSQVSTLNENLSIGDSKIKELEGKLDEARKAKNVTDAQTIEKQKNDALLIQAKEAELNDLKMKLQHASSTSSEIESQLVKLKDSLTDKEKSINDLTKSVLDAEAQTKALDQHYLALIAAKELEVKTKVDQLSSLSGADQSQLQQKDVELKELLGKNQQLTTEISQLQSLIHQTKESEQATLAKGNMLQARLHQLEQEATAAKAESNTLKAKAGDIEKVNLALQESDKKIKEWEGRWKQASIDAEQYKVAHDQAAKEKDEAKLISTQLESNLNAVKTQLENQHKEHESVHHAFLQANKERDEIKSHFIQMESNLGIVNTQFDTLQKEHEATKNAYTQSTQKMVELQAASLAADEKLKALSKQLEESNYFGGEWEGRYHEASDKLAVLIQQLESSNNDLASKDRVVHELNALIEQRTSDSAKALQSMSSLEGRSAEWENKYKEANSRFQSELAKAQQTIATTKDQANESDARYKELNNKYQSELAKAQQTIAAIKDQTNESDARYKDLNNKYQAEVTKANQVASSSQNLAKEWESKYHALNDTLNTMQASLADTQKKAASLSELEKKKSNETEAKYRAEVTAWQKRITDLEASSGNALALVQKRHTKEIDDHKKQISSLQNEIIKLKSTPKSILTSREEITKVLPKPKSVMPKAITALATSPVVPKSTPTPKAITALATSPVVPKSTPTPKAITGLATSSVVPKSTPTPKPVIAVNKPKLVSTPTAATPTVDWKAAATILGRKVKGDDHIIIEGIGPKINALLKKNNIKTWVQLSNSPIQDIQTILDKGGSKFSLAEPTSWPAQARLASMGAWSELKKLQDHLTAGRAKKKAKSQPTKTKVKSKATLIAKPIGSKMTKPAKAIFKSKSAVKAKPITPKINKPLDLLNAKVVFGNKVAMDDLKLIEGIGPKIEKLLIKGNIKTWKALAASNTKTIQTILDKAGSRFALADPKTWAKQSSLASAGKWTKLKAMQDKLKGGK